MVYILKLTQGKWYIGFTENPLKRIDAHRRGKGSAMTKKFPVKNLVHLTCGDEHMEDTLTIDMMLIYGKENVRGGRWATCSNDYASLDLSNKIPMVITKKIEDTKDCLQHIDFISTGLGNSVDIWFNRLLKHHKEGGLCILPKPTEANKVLLKLTSAGIINQISSTEFKVLKDDFYINL